jgi:hypothetical protein
MSRSFPGDLGGKKSLSSGLFSGRFYLKNSLLERILLFGFHESLAGREGNDVI